MIGAVEFTNHYLWIGFLERGCFRTFKDGYHPIGRLEFTFEGDDITFSMRNNLIYIENEFSDRKGIPVERRGRKVTGLTSHETA